LLLGILADWYGRKKAYQFFMISSLGLAIGAYFIDDPYGWLVLRFFCGAAYLAANTAKNVFMVIIFLYLKICENGS
jgi:MFS family permease